MSVVGILYTHAVAHREKKLPFFFSRFNFERMKKHGNTHFCFFCLSSIGFKQGSTPNEPKDHVDESGYNGMQYHDVTHLCAVIGNADKYSNVWDWLDHEVPENFPCVVHVPSV